MQVSSKTFQKKRMSLKVSYGKKIVVSKEDMAEKLYEHFKDTKKMEIHMNFKLDHCAICETTWSSGDFATEKLLLIPKSNAAQENGTKPCPVHVTVPRVVCMSCSQTLSEEDQADREESATACTLSSAWRVSMEKLLKKQPQKSKLTNLQKAGKGQGRPYQRQTMARFPPIRSPPIRNGETNQRPSASPQPAQKLAEKLEGLEMVDQPSGSTEATSGDGDSYSHQSLVDQKGFLVCTQLVKTGGADRAGLQVGDIFIKCGHMEKQNFGGLKSLATFIRGSANQSIECVVLRQMNAGENSRGKRPLKPMEALRHSVSSGGTFQKIRLHLTPLGSHDADGGGVLGAVMNLWPLPQPKTSK